MGLDVAELILALEREFEVKLSDVALRHVATVGELFALVAPSQGGAAGIIEVSARDALWTRYLDVVERELGVDRKLLVPTARFHGDLSIW